MGVNEMDQEVNNAIAELVGTPGKDMAFGGAFEGADRFDRWLSTWQPGLNSADTDMLGSKPIADARSRDAARNDGYVQSGANIHKDNIVGAMYLLNSKPNMRGLGLDDETWEEEAQEEFESKFTLAAESPNCWLDAQRSKTLTGMVRLAIGIYAQAGEILASAEWLRDKPRPFSTAVQLIDLDRLGNPYDPPIGSIVRGGVRQNRHGAALGYYIRNAHPTDYDRPFEAVEYKYVPASKPWGRKQIIHLKEEVRPAQTRAVADIVAGLKAIKITQKFRDVTLQQAVVQAMYAMSIESDMMPAEAYAAMGAQNIDIGTAMADYGLKYMAAVNAYTGKKGIMIDGVKIPHFFPGTRLNAKTTNGPGGVGQEFEQSLLRYIAAILGVSYEQLSKDFSKTNYSSARAALTETWKYMQSRKRMVADRFASHIYMLWFEEQMNAGELECMKYSKLPNYYDGLNAEAYTQCEWIGAARGQIDELKETQAAVLRIKFGLSTHEDELAKLGKDWRQVYRQLSRETKERERLNIVLQEDNSVNAASGSPRETDQKATDGEDADAKQAA